MINRCKLLRRKQGLRIVFDNFQKIFLNKDLLAFSRKITKIVIYVLQG